MHQNTLEEKNDLFLLFLRKQIKIINQNQKQSPSPINNNTPNKL